MQRATKGISLHANIFILTIGGENMLKPYQTKQRPEKPQNSEFDEVKPIKPNEPAQEPKK
jgi:hypothetical protein